MDKYLVKNESTGKTQSFNLSYEDVINAGIMRTIERDGDTYKIVGKVNDQFKGVGAKRRSSLVTRRSSIAAGVHRHQVEEARGVAKQLNPGIEINNDGTVAFGSRRARKDWLKHQNLRDNEGGYGD